MKRKPKDRVPFAKLGDVLKYMREKDLKISQQKLADVVGVHVQFVSNWERGLCAPPQHCHVKLAKAFKLGPPGLENMQREKIWQALMDDYGHDLNLKYGGLV